MKYYHCLSTDSVITFYFADDSAINFEIKLFKDYNTNSVLLNVDFPSRIMCVNHTHVGFLTKHMLTMGEGRGKVDVTRLNNRFSKIFIFMMTD